MNDIEIIALRHLIRSVRLEVAKLRDYYETRSVVLEVAIPLLNLVDALDLNDEDSEFNSEEVEE